MIDVIPDLQTCIIILGFGLGYLIGNAGYNFDGEVKYGFGKEWFDKQNLLVKWFVSFLLDILHHWEYGLLSIIIGYLYLSDNWQMFAWYFGWGFIISDLKDFNNILIRLGLKPKEPEPPVEPEIPQIPPTTNPTTTILPVNINTSTTADGGTVEG